MGARVRGVALGAALGAALGVALAVVAGCSGGGGGGFQGQPVSGGAVKGPLANADAAAHAFDPGGPGFAGSPVASGTTNAAAALVGLSLPLPLDPPYILAVTENGTTTDLTTGQAPVIGSLRTVITQQMLNAGTPVYATLQTTIAHGLAVANAGSGVPPYPGDGVAPVTEQEFLDALPVAAAQVASTFGFGLTGVDLFGTPPLLTDATDTPEEQAAVAAYRTGTEALGALIFQMAQAAGVSAPAMLAELIADLADGTIDGVVGGAPSGIIDAAVLAVLAQDPATLPIPNSDDGTGSPILVGDVQQVLADETGTTGAGVDTTPLTDGTITTTPAPAELDSDRDDDGHPNAVDAFPDDPAEWADADNDGTGDNGDVCPDDADNDGDADGICNGASFNDPATGAGDNCPADANADQADADDDGAGDVCDPDDDNDGVEDGADQCPGFDDNLDADTDGIPDGCDADLDGDGVPNDADIDPANPFVCADDDADTCDDCTSGAFDPAADGPDFDVDGACDAGDNDDDGDGRADADDSAPLDPNVCADTDGDTCDDCSSGTFDPANDGTDTDGDGLCDVGDNDADNDGRQDDLDSDPGDPFVCADTDADTCDDCSSGTFDPAADGQDFDVDGACDAGDNDDDGDGRADADDSAPLDPNVCADTDTDTCDDCSSGIFNPAADGPDFDADGFCDAGDVCGSDPNNDADGDGYCANEDNCPVDFNADQANEDGDAFGDVCDPCLGDADNVCGPPAPTGVSAIGSDGEVTLNWSPVAGALSYNVYWNNSGAVTTADSTVPVTGPSFTHTGLTNGTPYYYAVTVIDAEGESVLSAEVVATPFRVTNFWAETWQSAALGTYVPGDLTFVQADGGSWFLEDTVSEFPECGPTPHRAEVFDQAGGHALRLTSGTTTVGGCADNVYLLLTEGGPYNVGFSVPFDPSTTVSFEESGFLENPEPGSTFTTILPHGDTVSLIFQDELGNLLAYIFQRAPDREMNTRNSFYREVYLDPDGGVFERNLFADFSTIPDFVPSPSNRIMGIQFAVDEHGWGVIDDIRLGTIEGPVNRAPTAYGVDVSTTIDTPVDGILDGSDPDGDPLTFSLAANGSLGTAQLLNATTGAFRYTPSPGVTGTDTFQFRASDGSANSNVATVLVEIFPAVPEAPTGVQASPDNAQVTISWSPVEGATSYNVYWNNSGGVTTADPVLAGVTSPFVHMGLTNDLTYYYVVTAVNTAGESVPSAEVSATPIDISVYLPAAPELLTAEPVLDLPVGTDGQIVLTFGPVAGAVSYNLYWNTTGDVTTADQRIPVSDTLGLYWHEGLNNDTRYYYRVAVVNAVGEGPLSAGVTAVPAAGAGNPGALANVGIGGLPVGIDQADFDGDSDVDLVVADQENKSGVVLFGFPLSAFINGLGRQEFETSLFGVATGDFNMDSHQDYAVLRAQPGIGGGEDPSLRLGSVRLGDGFGNFPTLSDTPVSSARSITAADFNGDLAPDLAFGLGGGSAGVAIALTSGTGSPGYPTNFLADSGFGSDVTDVGVGDFDEDGHADLAVATTRGNMNLLFGTGTGGFTDLTLFPAGTWPSAVAVEDFNGDGHLDMAVANRDSADVTVRLGNGLGGLSAASNYPVGPGPRDVAAGDFNGDGVVDLATADFLGDGISILIGDGFGGFSAPLAVLVGVGPVALVACDLDGDVFTDLAVANRNSGEVSMIRSGELVLLAEPSNVQALPGNGQVTVNWDPVAGATSYNLYWNTTGGVTMADTVVANVTAPFVHMGLTNGMTYWYAVTASNSTGESSVSAEVSATPATD